MESLAQAATVIVISSAIAGGLIGSGIGYIISRYTKISKLRCLLIGGIAGIPAGLFVLTQIIQSN